VKADIDVTEETAPKSSVAADVLLGVFGSGPTPAVKMSMSVWMR